MKTLITVLLIIVLNISVFGQTNTKVLIDDGVEKDIENTITFKNKGTIKGSDVVALLDIMESRQTKGLFGIDDLHSSDIQFYDYYVSEALSIGFKLPWLTSSYKESKSSRIIIQEFLWYYDILNENSNQSLGKIGVSIRLFVAVKDFTDDISGGILEFLAASSQLSGYETLFRLETRGITGAKVNNELATISVGKFDVDAYGRTRVAIENIRKLVSDSTTVLKPMPLQTNVGIK